MAEPKISFVILTWNSAHYIETCVNSILTDTSKSELMPELFIVDNGSRDSSPSIIRGFQKEYPDIVFPIFLKKNSGTTYSRNIALKKARGEFICILDSDIEILPDFFTRMIQTFSQKASVGLVAPKLIYPNGNLQKSTDQFPTVLRKVYRYLFLKELEKKERLKTISTEVRTVDYAISAVWVFKKSTMDRIGFLDENIFYAPEDVDYCLRIWKDGKQVVYNPTASAIHHTQEISRRFKINKATIHHILGLGYFFFKHRFFFTKPSIKIKTKTFT